MPAREETKVAVPFVSSRPFFLCFGKFTKDCVSICIHSLDSCVSYCYNQHTICEIYKGRARNMLKVMDLLSFKEFENFKLISDSSGLNNTVSGVGMVDWETAEEIEKDFAPEDFVFITLYMMDSVPEDMTDRFRALFRKNVAAVGVKVPDVSSFEFPGEIVALANSHRVSLFLYQDVYLEDLFFAIHSALFFDDANQVALDYLRLIQECDKESIPAVARKLNPLFKENLVCFCCIPLSDDREVELEKALEQYRTKITHAPYNYKSADSFIKCNKCIIIISTEEKEFPGRRESLVQILDNFGFDKRDFAIGCSTAKSGLRLLREGLEEATNAALSAFINGRPLRLYQEIGADGLILPFLSSKSHVHFYKKTLEVIQDYDQNHSAHLLETLLCYIDCEGDVARTAKKLYQHGNTVRYRLDKIKTILGITVTTELYVTMYAFAKMHKIYQILQDESLI